jgi:hypothetical protein
MLSIPVDVIIINTIDGTILLIDQLQATIGIAPRKTSLGERSSTLFFT